VKLGVSGFVLPRTVILKVLRVSGLSIENRKLVSLIFCRLYFLE
jgi:hypothetical protein